MEPAATIIRMFGGASKLAGTLGLHRASVAKWAWSRERGGLAGRVPQAHHRCILATAAARRAGLTAESLLPSPAVAAAENHEAVRA